MSTGLNYSGTEIKNENGSYTMAGNKKFKGMVIDGLRDKYGITKIIKGTGIKITMRIEPVSINNVEQGDFTDNNLDGKGTRIWF